MRQRVTRSWPRAVRIALLSLLLALLAGCTSQGFQVDHLGKSDIDFVADAHQRAMHGYLETLLTKLYKRNPRELAKAPGATLASRQAQLFAQPGRLQFDELGQAQEVEAMLLAFDPAFTGDRVFALMVGVVGMVRHSYNYDPSFHLLDSLDQQKLYLSARNLEVLSWRLRTRQQDNGEPFLYTDGLDGPVVNLSFTRLFGKMIATQDMLAQIVAERSNRTINFVAHNAASMVFFPF